MLEMTPFLIVLIAIALIPLAVGLLVRKTKAERHWTKTVAALSFVLSILVSAAYFAAAYNYHLHGSDDGSSSMAALVFYIVMIVQLIVNVKINSNQKRVLQAIKVRS